MRIGYFKKQDFCYLSYRKGLDREGDRRRRQSANAQGVRELEIVDIKIVQAV